MVYKGAFGLANREWNITNTTDTRFMIGSVSKPITAFLTLIQVQKSLISLDKTLGKAYETLNLKKEGIAAYERILEIFLNYVEAKNRLKVLK